jgi:flagellin
MSRINTNISSLLAQQALNTSNDNLQTALTRLSTGKQINSGADNPSGLIAAQALGSEITNTQQAVSNSQMASNVISTADSALGQISTLLTTIQGLVNQSASTGTMSPSAIAANQTVIDSSLDAINQIASTTAFQGQNLLNGGLAFKTAPEMAAGVDTTAGTAFASQVAGLQLNQATLGTDGTLGVNVNVSAAATGAYMQTETDDANYGTAATATATTAKFTNGTGGSGTGKITITAPEAGAQYNNVHLIIQTGNVAATAPTAAYNATTKDLTVTINGATPTTQDAIIAAINKQTNFTATDLDAGAGTDVVNPTGADSDLPTNGILDAANTGTTGANGGNLTNAVQFTLTGSLGSHTFSFAAGTTAATMAGEINQYSSSTGVYASLGADNTGTKETALQLSSIPSATSADGYGSSALVQVTMLNGTAFDNGFTDVNGNSIAGDTANGTNVAATVNGVNAVGNGNTLSVDNAALSMSMTLNPGASGDTDGNINFNITGGGATFQIGPTVNAGGQATLGIAAANTSTLGGVDGVLDDLYSNGTAALATDPTTAAAIVNEATNQVTSLRGQLGAFQSATLDSNINSLNAAVTNLTSAQSSIQDTDFAAESAALTQAQVLVQSGTAVLSIANHAPANVLTLLQGAAQV